MSFFFVQMADPQFGMFASISQLDEAAIEERRKRGINVRLAEKKITGFADETALFEKAIAGANRLNPAFVVVCGDMIHDSSDPDQLADLMRIRGDLSEDIPLHWVAGNHDVGDSPTAESIAIYRQRFGNDNFSFDHQRSHFVVVNSCVCSDPSNVPEEWERILEFLKTDLDAARANGCENIVIFMHHPLFLDRPDEDDGYFSIPRKRREVLLDVLKSHGVSAVFAGHLHKNAYGTDGDLQMVTTSAVGYPLGDDPSGFRIVKVIGNRIEHEYFGFEDLPDAVEL